MIKGFKNIDTNTTRLLYWLDKFTKCSDSQLYKQLIISQKIYNKIMLAQVAAMN